MRAGCEGYRRMSTKLNRAEWGYRADGEGFSCVWVRVEWAGRAGKSESGNTRWFVFPLVVVGFCTHVVT